ncbi:MAG: hypothetical protein NTV34_05295 [Proteobacteria bacterium]|nr:hypothetical protein [Pseudomonadota bacterium]
MKVIATAPTRIDLAGGTLDLWPIHNLLPECATVNVAVSLNATVTVEISSNGLFGLISLDQEISEFGTFSEICASSTLKLLGLLLSSVWTKDLPAITITTSAKSPAGAGLGGSSCLSVTTIKALWQAKALLGQVSEPLTEELLVKMAQDIESLVIHAPTGVQDYWAAVRGGINILRYHFGKTEVETFDTSALSEANFKLVCVYSGKSRSSAVNNWDIFKRIFDGDKNLLERMVEIGHEAHNCAEAMIAGDWNEVLNASKREWLLRCKLWPAIETFETKSLDKAAKDAGAFFSRVCGAGGGGVMAIFAPLNKASLVEQSVIKANGQLLDVIVGFW